MPPSTPVPPEDEDLLIRIGPLQVDWPKSIGYFGGIWLAVACDLIAPPIGVFIAAIPVFKLFQRPGQPWPIRLAAQALEGAAKPLGGDAESTVRLGRQAVKQRVHATARRRRLPRAA